MGPLGSKRAGQRSKTVREDWSAWLPAEMDQLFGATRTELEYSNVILSVALDEAIALCEQEQFTVAQERAMVFAELFDRLAIRLRLVIRTIEDSRVAFWNFAECDCPQRRELPRSNRAENLFQG